MGIVGPDPCEHKCSNDAHAANHASHATTWHYSKLPSRQVARESYIHLASKHKSMENGATLLQRHS